MIDTLTDWGQQVFTAIGITACALALLLIPFAVGDASGFERGYSLGLEAGRAIAATPRDLADYDCNWDYPSPRP